MREKTLFFIGVWLIVLAYLIALPTQVKNILFAFTGLIIIVMSYGSYFPKINTKKTYENNKNPNDKIPFEIKTQPKVEVKEKKEEFEVTISPISSHDIKPSYEPVYQVRKARIKRVVHTTPEDFTEEDDVVVINNEEALN